MIAIYCGDARNFEFEPDCETEDELPKQALQCWLDASSVEGDAGDGNADDWTLASAKNPEGDQMVVWAMPYRGESVTLILDLQASS